MSRRHGRHDDLGARLLPALRAGAARRPGFAPIPAPIVAAALAVAYPGLNGVYLTFLSEGDPAAALDRISSTLFLSAGAGLYGLVGLPNPPHASYRVSAGGYRRCPGDSRLA